jgi:Skp family chaperone for outer membrane proteins
MPARNEVQRILDQETAIWEQRFQEDQQELQALLDSTAAVRTGLETLRDTLSVGEREPSAIDSLAADTLRMARNLRTFEDSLERKKREVLASYHRIYGENGVLNRRNAELTQSILEKLHAAISEISQSYQVSIMLDASALLYIDQDFNYTEQAMEALNIDTQGTR